MYRKFLADIRFFAGFAGMKQFVVAGLIFLASCSTTQKSPVREDSLMLTRKYVGNFVEYRQHIPEKFGEPHLIWIKTTMDSTLGKIAAYGERCDFRKGDRLYIKRIYLSPGPVSSYWEYRIESDDNPVSYRLSEYQSDKKNLIKNWF
ncbi:MAG: hypothetical protein WCE64_15955 [Bacteroidales bacterium]